MVGTSRMTYSPTVRRRRLSLALAQFRENAGMSATAVARALGWNPSKVTRIERNEWRQPDLGDVLDLLDLYEIDDAEVRNAIVSLVREGGKRGWWEEGDFKDALGGLYVGLEWEAHRIQTFEALAVLGLGQTADYARAIFRGGGALNEAEIQRRVDGRLARQKLLDRAEPPILEVVLDEAALRKHVGGVEVMRGQLQHLRQLAERPTVRIQVMPDAVGAHAAMSGSFTILDYRQPEMDPSVVHVEIGKPGDLFIEKIPDVEEYRRRFEQLGSAALSVADSKLYIEDLINRPM